LERKKKSINMEVLASTNLPFLERKGVERKQTRIASEKFIKM